jgi:hypothetical protein
LVATPNDFGLAGARPTHPALLDWLASEFMRQGWSLKKLNRLIVSSAVYRESSGASPVSSVTSKTRRLGKGEEESPSVLYAQFELSRLSAEQLRDALLSVSGLLTNKTGGAPVWPTLPAEILQANPAFLDDNEMKTKGWYPSSQAEQNARSIYLVQKRTVRVPFLETFDLPENSVSCARRNSSIVAPQAFTLLNSSLAVEAARALAVRVKGEAGPRPEAQVERAFGLTLQRKPSRSERAASLRLLQDRSLVELCRALLNLNEFAYVD